MLPDPEALADVVVQTIEMALGPVLERLAAAEARLSTLGDLRDRVVTVETKAAMPVPISEPVDLAPVLTRLSVAENALLVVAKHDDSINALRSILAEEVSGLRERVAVVETRPALPGPQGEPGAPGANGQDGKDGTAGLSFEGVYQEGKSYDLGNLVTWGGSSWHCNEPTTTKPGDGSKAWTLMVKRGRDGRDGQDAPGLPVVSVGRAR